MPADSGMAFVVVLHQSADRKSMLASIISHWTAMRVREAVDSVRLLPDIVHVVPGGTIATLSGGVLKLRHLAPDAPRVATPIDTFFDSLAADCGEDAVGIVLSGTGHDGALGLKAIKALNGTTFAQGADGSAPQHAGMPSSAIATGAVDVIVPVEEMPERLMALSDRLSQVRPLRDGLAEDEDERVAADRRRICELLRDRIGHDFMNYKERTFMRRVARRMQVLGVTTLHDYVARLESERGEPVLLFRDLLIGVTTFFRDAAAFESVAQLVMPRLFTGKGAADTVRVWVAGCATGEEAYSLAILLREHMDGIEVPPRVQVFATDIDEQAIDTARAGRYPPTLLDGMSPQRRERFFSRSDGSFLVARQTRDLCTFSTHSLVRDPPFSRLDMVSCRNLLIYLDAELQANIVPAFHYALAPGGILLLGSSETVVRHEALFAPLDKDRRIFYRRDGPAKPLHLPSQADLRASTVGQHAEKPASPARSEPAVNWSQAVTLANARVLERFAAPFAIVTADGTLVHYSSHSGHFLLPSLGVPSRNVFDMARRDLRLGLRAALRQATETERTVEQPATLNLDGDGYQAVTLVVEPLPSPGADPLYLIVFRTAAPLPPVRADEAQPAQGIVAQMEREMRDTREQLQSLAEEHQTALEELRSANEELHSVNEELQSTNEELETSKEEIQSVNEELQTVNLQLSGKVDELNRANSDLQNLFESTRVATVFLDQGTIIRAYTPEVGSIYNLIPSDRGRPLTDIVSRLSYDGLRDDIQTVRQTLEPLERRVSRSDGSAHYLLRILPYRSPDSTVDGTLVTFVDVTSIVQAEQHQRLLVDELNHRVKNMLAVVISLFNQTMRRVDSMEEFSTVFLGRVHALTAAYSLLTRENWSHVVFRDVLVEELKPFMAADCRNVRFEGPDVALDPRGALAFGMAIHELATNAAKYGALSVPEGDLSVTWTTEQTAGGGVLCMEWTERNGPPVAVPSRRGFGSVLVERGIAHELRGKAQIDFHPSGVQARLCAPLPKGLSMPADRASVS